MTYEVSFEREQLPWTASCATAPRPRTRLAINHEQAIPIEYLAQLHRHYERWIARYDLSPVLVVETDACNLATEESELSAVADRVQRRLEATRGYSLPL